jgi:hypothetical protein
MSRTYRRRNLKEFSYYENPLRESGYVYDEEGNGWWGRYFIDPRSKEGKRRLAQFHSDRGHGWMNWKGPSWFHLMFEQVPYRAWCRQQIIHWMKDPENRDVVLPSKPSREYWL